ncbi:hypothetical protein RUND412_000773 [Rhizina undulata]
MAEKETFEHVDQSTARANSDSEAGLDLAYEKTLIHKVDWRLLPIMGALYSVALIDRGNISNAAIAGMLVDLELSVGSRYSIALLMFFIPYFIFELPSNIILRRVGAAVWLGTIALFWGGVMIGMGFLHDWRLLVVCRTILGFCEAGFFPGCVYLISCWYIRYEVQKRLAGFYLISVLVGGFSSILAYGLMHMDGLGGLRGWRWIFIIEGILTCMIALGAYILIIDFPDKVLSKRGGKFLTESDVELIKARIDRDRQDSQADPLTWAKVRKHLSDWKLWIYGLLFMCSTMPAYAFAYFLPIILRGMGYTSGMSQILSAPPFVFAVIIAFSLAWAADKARMRGPFIAFQSIVAIVGLLLTAYHHNNGVRYFGTFLGIAGCQGNVPAVLAYQSNNIRMNSKRSVGSALQIGFGGVGGIFASTVYREVDAPRYLNGLWATIGCQLFILIAIVGMSVYFAGVNRDKREGRIREIEGNEAFEYTI